MKIEILYPEIADLYGDRFNIDYLCRCVKNSEIVETHINEEPYFAKHKVDLIYMGPTKEKYQTLIIEKLKPYTQKIKELIENNTVFLMTGNAFEVFGQKINDETALGIFDYYATSDLSKHESCCYLSKYEGIEIIGFTSRYSKVFNNDKPLFEITKCKGWIEENKNDGYHYKNFMATYSIGPVLIYNPLFTKKFLDLFKIEYHIEYEDIAMKAYQQRLAIFKRKDIGINNTH